MELVVIHSRVKNNYEHNDDTDKNKDSHKLTA